MYQEGVEQKPNPLQIELVGGMTLRDYFAGQALAGGMLEFLQGGDAWESYDDFARSVYRMADAMVKERVK